MLMLIKLLWLMLMSWWCMWCRWSWYRWCSYYRRWCKEMYEMQCCMQCRWSWCRSSSWGWSSAFYSDGFLRVQTARDLLLRTSRQGVGPSIRNVISPQWNVHHQPLGDRPIDMGIKTTRFLSEYWTVYLKISWLYSKTGYIIDVVHCFPFARPHQLGWTATILDEPISTADAIPHASAHCQSLGRLASRVLSSFGNHLCGVICICRRLLLWRLCCFDPVSSGFLTKMKP